MRLLGSARYFVITFVSYSDFLPNFCFASSPVSDVDFFHSHRRQRERERERERRKIRDGKNKSLFLHILRLRKTAIITALSDYTESIVFIIIAFRVRRKRRKKNGTTRTLHICFEAYAREKFCILFSAQRRFKKFRNHESTAKHIQSRQRVIYYQLHFSSSSLRRVPKTTTNAAE